MLLVDNLAVSLFKVHFVWLCFLAFCVSFISTSLPAPVYVYIMFSSMSVITLAKQHISFLCMGLLFLSVRMGDQTFKQTCDPCCFVAVFYTRFPVAYAVFVGITMLDFPETCMRRNCLPTIWIFSMIYRCNMVIRPMP